MARILYVEDHPPAQYLMDAIISEMTAHELLLASSGAEAEQLAESFPPDLYILDLDLPDTDGLRLAETLRAAHPAPVILVSAYAEAVDEAALDDMHYLAKPLEPDHVADTIRRALAG
ncbi:MAG: response regulator [Chloroflexi bacterium]|nr:response regulator [Chloroflexota bacterium]